jgi:hypothetical protein
MSAEMPKFWGKFQILLAVTSFVANIVTFVALFIALKGGGLSQNVAIVFLAVINASLIITAYLAMRNHQKDHELYKDSYIIIEEKQKIIGELEKKLNLQLTQTYSTSNIVHNFCHEYRSIIGYLIENTQGLSLEDYLDIKSSFQKFLLFALTNIKELFDILTGDACSVCIKIIVADKNVKTLSRDPVSYRMRHETDNSLPSFPINGNTAFSIIVSDKVSDSTYVSNNLQSEEEYINLNGRWKKLYNACMVVPIRISYKDGDSVRSNVIGFLCVDNMAGNFDKSNCLNLLSAFGDMFFHLLNLYGKLERPTPSS